MDENFIVERQVDGLADHFLFIDRYVEAKEISEAHLEIVFDKAFFDPVAVLEVEATKLLS